MNAWAVAGITAYVCFASVVASVVTVFHWSQDKAKGKKYGAHVAVIFWIIIFFIWLPYVLIAGTMKLCSEGEIK